MSKVYYVGSDDGRAVYAHKKYERFYVQHLGNKDEELTLFRTRSRKEAEQACKRTNEVWKGFKVKRLKGGIIL